MGLFLFWPETETNEDHRRRWRKLTHTHRDKDVDSIVGRAAVQKVHGRFDVVHGRVDVVEGDHILLGHVIQLEEGFVQAGAELS